MTNSDRGNDFSLLWKIILGLFSFIILFSTLLLIYKFYTAFNGNIFPTTTRAEWGAFGDYFGGTLNPIFGFSSFIALLVTIFYQAKELKLSRNELELTRKELSNSATALANQNKAIELQSFEQTFFSWLNSYRSLLETITIQKTKNEVSYSISGRSALFSFWKHYFSLGFFDLNTSTKNEDINVEDVKQKWENLYTENQYQIDSLFRTLYKLILWIDSQSDDKLSQLEKWTYISIVRSQLSWIEMVFLYCNGLTFRGSKFKIIAEKYAIFDNLELNEKNLESLYSNLKFPDGYAEEAYSSNHAKEKLGLPKSHEKP